MATECTFVDYRPESTGRVSGLDKHSCAGSGGGGRWSFLNGNVFALWREEGTNRQQSTNWPITNLGLSRHTLMSLLLLSELIQENCKKSAALAS